MLQPQWRKPPTARVGKFKVKQRTEADPAWPAVLFVCTANRIRSPLAEYLLLDLLDRRAGSVGPWRVESAGVWAQEGLPVLDAVYRVGLDYRFDLGSHRARAVSSLALEEFDLILTMERTHTATLVNEFPHLHSRILTLGEALSGYAFDIVDPPGHTSRSIRATGRELAEILAWGFDRLPPRLEERRTRGVHLHAAA